MQQITNLIPKTGNVPVFTVSELTQAIAHVLEDSFPFVWVLGEISNIRTPASGHMYFTLKDKFAQIRAVCFRGTRLKFKFKPKDGMEVICFGRVNVYSPRGEYQIIVDIMEPRGLGALQAAFEELKRKLLAEGLFEESRKKPLPLCPQNILIVTSATGAAIRDILRILEGAPFGVNVTVIPVQVQGDSAPEDMVRAFEWVNEHAQTFAWDLVIVGRGGGSLEDLWAFNDERLARAVAACVIPTISAVGHEIDYTICDFVADCRAPTPTAAAELIVRRQKDVLQRMEKIGCSLMTAPLHMLERHRHRVELYQRRIRDPRTWVDDRRLILDDRQERIIRAMNRIIDIQYQEHKMFREKLLRVFGMERVSFKKQHLDILGRGLFQGILNILRAHATGLQKAETSLRMLSPYKVLERGYAIVERIRDGAIVKHAFDVEVGDKICIKFNSSALVCTVNGKVDKEAAGKDLSFKTAQVEMPYGEE